ncbi:MAG: hypothetical protein AMXMBFR64_35850 [Myxococcales bacterium]
MSPSRERAAIRPEINVTPLVDVVLVLLIIFMVITPQMVQGFNVELPKVVNPDATPKGSFSPVTLTLLSTGTLFLEKARVDLDAVAEHLRAVRAREPSRKVVLKADRAVPFGQVRALFKLCRDIGFPGVSLQVTERKAST